MSPRAQVLQLSLRLLCCLLPFLAGGCRKDNGRDPARTAVKRERWPTISLEDAGLDGSKLRDFSAAVRGNGVIIRHDAIAYQWGEPDKPLDIASASKAIYSALVFKSIESGRIPSLDQPVVEWMPELAKLNPALGHKDARITWRHLLNQTSCYGVSEEPGTAFDYNDYQTGLLWTLIFQKVHGVSGQDGILALRSQIFDPIGVANKPTFRAMKSNATLARLVISPLDMARFGLLFLHDGKWKDRQILSAEHVRLVRQNPLPVTLPRSKGVHVEMLPDAPTYGGGKNQDDHLGCYSHMWWLNRRDKTGALLFPSAPEDALAAIGYGGEKVLMIVPSLDLIISWNTESLARAPMVSVGRQQMEAVLKIGFSAVLQ